MTKPKLPQKEGVTISILEIFCNVDDFMLVFDRWLKEHALTETPSPRGRKANLSMSDVMTILIWFHHSHYRDFKTFYLNHVCQHLRSEFPKLVSYSRFVDLIPGKSLTFANKKYRLIGVPFYNNEDENQFRTSLESALNQDECNQGLESKLPHKKEYRSLVSLVAQAFRYPGESLFRQIHETFTLHSDGKGPDTNH